MEYQIVINFVGRCRGAIGRRYLIRERRTFDHLPNYEEVSALLYRDYEHISHLNFLWLEGETE